MDKHIVTTYWANTSSNGLAGKLIREGSADMKMKMEDLLSGGTFHREVSVMIEKMIDEWFKESTSSYNTRLVSWAIQTVLLFIAEQNLGTV